MRKQNKIYYTGKCLFNVIAELLIQMFLPSIPKPLARIKTPIPYRIKLKLVTGDFESDGNLVGPETHGEKCKFSEEEMT